MWIFVVMTFVGVLLGFLMGRFFRGGSLDRNIRENSTNDIAATDCERKMSQEEQQFWEWLDGKVEEAQQKEYFLVFSIYMSMDLKLFSFFKNDYLGDKLITNKLSEMGFEIWYKDNFIFTFKVTDKYAMFVKQIDFPKWVDYFQDYLDKYQYTNGTIYINSNYLLKDAIYNRAFLFILNNYSTVEAYLNGLGFKIKFIPAPLKDRLGMYVIERA